MKKSLLLFTLFASFLGHSQTFTRILKSTAFDRDTTDRYGWDVDISGNFAVIGAYADDFGNLNPNMGSAYIYEKTAPDTWTFVQKIQNSDQDDYDRFGYSVAIDGDLIVIGAYGEDHDENDANNMSKAGSAYIFERDGSGTWNEVQKIVASDRTAGDEFGWCVAISDSTIAVGAHTEEHDVNGLNPIHHAGAVYMFERNVSGVWQQTQKVVHLDRAPDINFPNGYSGEDQSDQFGGSIGLSGDYMVVSAHMHDWNETNTSTNWAGGAAYIFERDGGGVWQQVKKLVNYDRRNYDRFGYAVSIDTNWIVVGAYTQDSLAPSGSDGLMNPGAAYIYERDAGGIWNLDQKIVAGDRNSGDHFGYSVDIDNGIIVLGSEQDDHDENATDALTDAGSAYIFTYDGTNWSQSQKIAADDRDQDDLFGISCAISGDEIVVGSFQHDLDTDSLNNVEDAGAAIFFTADICLTPITSSQNFNECFGFSITVGSNTYSTTGTYIDTLVAANGCDSVVTTDLTVGPDLSSSQNIFRCFGESYSIGTSTYSATGTYMDTLTAVDGCDSIITTNLTIGPDLSDSQNIFRCFGGSYSIGTSTYTSSGTYMDTLVGSNGCDSVVTTNLTIGAQLSSSNMLTICFGQTHTVGSSSYTTTGIYTDTITASNGCDSIVTTDLTVEAQINTNVTQSNNTLSSDAFATTYQWLDCDNGMAPISGALGQTYIPTTPGNYAVIVTIGSCSDTSTCYQVTVFDGVDELQGINCQIYPNPAQNSITIALDEFISGSVQIINIEGALIEQSSFLGKQTKLNIEALSNGIYTIQITTEKGVVRRQFIKH